MKNFKYIYGPVYSWRLGLSLGIDLLSDKEKRCTFNCGYCQVGDSSAVALERKVFVPTASIMRELGEFKNIKVDYITFSGKGEPTLALNLGEVISAVRKTRGEKIAVFTNSTMLCLEDVRRELCLADMVMAKLDAATDATFKVVNKQAEGVRLSDIVEGIRRFRGEYKGKLALQVMFVKENIEDAEEIAAIARTLGPDEVQLNTPTRHRIKNALNKTEIDEIKKYFNDFKTIAVYDKEIKADAPVNKDNARERRG